MQRRKSGKVDLTHTLRLVYLLVGLVLTAPLHRGPFIYSAQVVVVTTLLSRIQRVDNASLTLFRMYAYGLSLDLNREWMQFESLRTKANSDLGDHITSRERA